MRALLSVAALAVLVASAAPAAAQSDDDGCTHVSPCPWFVDVDATGFYLERMAPGAITTTFTKGDWYELGVTNDDLEASHTVSLSGHDVSVTVPADSISDDTGSFQFTKTGDFTLKDMPSGDTVTIHVIEGDAVAAEDGEDDGDDDSKGAPGPAVAVLAVALVALAALRRR